MQAQPGILGEVPRLARYLQFSIKPSVNPADVLSSLAASTAGEGNVVGIGGLTVRALGTHVPGLRVFPAHLGAAVEVPSTPMGLWCWLRGADRGELLHRSRILQSNLSPAFRVESTIDAFQYGASLDLTGYEDGTENPTGDKAAETALVSGQRPGLDGSSFVAVQQWIHDLDTFQAMPQQEQDHTIGRRKSDNEEIDDAPESAHVKRTAQESFEPEAFVLRRSMPWADATRSGLVFVAFGRSFNPFEALLTRMVGVDDGVTDALFRFTRPVSGSYFWCPPVKDGKLDLGELGL